MGSGNAGSQVDGAQAHAEARGPTLVRTAQRRPRVLMLEDNLLFARLTRKALKSCVEVTIVATAHAAMDRLGAGRGLVRLRLRHRRCPTARGSTRRAKLAEARPHGAGPGHFGLDPTGRRQRGVPAGRAVPGQAVQGGRDCGGRRAGTFAARGRRRAWPRSRATRRRPTWKPSPGELRGLVADVRAEDARIGQADARRNYRLAALAKAANGLPNDAATTFDACANAAGVSRQTLQEYATLTTRWSPEQIARMLSLTDRTGKALTRAHLLRFARGPLEVRAAFEAAVATGEFDIGELQGMLRKARGASR